jgi:hypothetical protein
MNQVSSNTQPIRLLHLPKTAGTTVASGLLRVFGRRHRFVFSSDPSESRHRFQALRDEERNSIRVFIGHSLFETGISEADNAQIVTFLREPVSRVKSFITHVSEGRSKYLTPDGKSPSDLTIDEFLESGNPELENLQTKALINRDRIESPSRIESLGEQEALRLAKKNLFEGVKAFGLQDRFDEGWVAIWTALEIRPPLFATMNQQRGTQRIDFTDEQIARIRELNRLDLALYAAAREEFQRRVERGAVPDESLEDFRRRQKNHGERFTQCWNRVRNLYYTCRRMRRRLMGS